MVGYVLLITFAVIISGIVYAWVKTYIPKESLECPDTVSVFIKNAECNGLELNLTLTNKGNFNVAGYFIKATTSPDQKLATLDLSKNITSGGESFQNAIVFELGENVFKPNQEKVNIFSLPLEIYSIEIIPVRWQEQENKKEFVSCGSAKVSEIIKCNP